VYVCVCECIGLYLNSSYVSACPLNVCLCARVFEGVCVRACVCVFVCA